MPTRDRHPARPFVLGLAGGIGSGKSTVAAAFEKLGCVVSDSDADAKAALDLEPVRDRLVDWWGERVLGDDRRHVSRSTLAEIIFADESERQRLEALVHPIVHEQRRKLIARATAAGAPGVIVDAPLLFEAGIDRECDAVIFVDASAETRLDRVRRSRGWTASELSRREASQAPIAEKRQRSRFRVQNDNADSTKLERAIAPIYAILRSEVGGSD